MSAGFSSLKQSLGRLRQATQPREPAEHCELCSLELPPRHRHLVELATQRLLCTCEACALLFSGQVETKFRRVPQRILRLDEFQLTDAQWDSLLIPINMAFFFHSTPKGRPVALYPSPAGATESLLDLSSWAEVVEANPILNSMEPDVEALLVNRVTRGGPHAGSNLNIASPYFLVPIDECFRLVGLIRMNWRGLSGGQDVWREIETFFNDLRQRATPHSGHVRY